MYSEQAHMANLQTQVRYTTHSSYHVQWAGSHNKSTDSGTIYNTLIIPFTTSRLTWQIYRLRYDIQHTRHTMYSEQAHMTNLQTRVRYTTHSSYHVQWAGSHGKSTGSGTIYNTLIIPCTASRLTWQIYRLRYDIQHTRHNMYSEQAHITNLQTRVRYTTHSS
jgi:hypothetical protein